jgi:hypothetical protein
VNERARGSRVEGTGPRLLASAGSAPRPQRSGAVDEAATLAALRRFTIQGLHLIQARRCARLQRRSRQRLGENDAWLVATAEALGAEVVGEDRVALERLGARYLRFRAPER